jgi:hypothetical protein
MNSRPWLRVSQPTRPTRRSTAWAITQPDQKIADQESQKSIHPPGAGDLTVPGVMADEIDPGDDNGGGQDQRELPPRVAGQRDGEPDGDVQQVDPDRPRV